MQKIEKILWGKVKIDGKVYHQVLILGDQIEERDKPRLKQLFDTSHEIGDWEKKKLLGNDPEVLLIASGWSGVLKIKDDFKEEVQKAGVKLQVVLTGRAKSVYNQLVSSGKKVNALIHTTC